MNKQLGFFIGGMIMFFAEFYVWSRFFDKKLDYKNFCIYLFVIILTLIGMINSFYVNAYIKMLVITILMCFGNWFIFRKKINETVKSYFVSNYSNTNTEYETKQINEAFSIIAEKEFQNLTDEKSKRVYEVLTKLKEN